MPRTSSDVTSSRGGDAVEQLFLLLRLFFLHLHGDANGIASADIHLAANVQLAIKLFAQLVAQEEGEPGTVVEAVHQRLAEEGIVEGC